MKPMLADDWDEAKVKFPVMWQPKIDGVRALNMTGALTGRSLKPHANRYTTQFYGIDEFAGLDGELAAQNETHPDLCRLTTSALNRIEGEPYTVWHLFDYVELDAPLTPYEERYERLVARVAELKRLFPIYTHHLQVVPSVRVECMDHLIQLDTKALEDGYEGSIIRNPFGVHKQGRSTVREGGLLRIKRFIEEEARVVAIEEGQTNLNEAKRNELGNIERSTHQENMVPNGMVGALLCVVQKDIVVKGRKLLQAGQSITVSPGRMPHEDRVRYFQEPNLLIGQYIKFQFFPQGVKDKPRFPTFQSIRMGSDL